MWRRSYGSNRNISESGGCRRTRAGSHSRTDDASADAGTSADSGTHTGSNASACADTANGPDLDV
jgi:hypothetical protein